MLKIILITLTILLIFGGGVVVGVFSFYEGFTRSNHLEWSKWYSDNKICIVHWKVVTDTSSTGKKIFCINDKYE